MFLRLVADSFVRRPRRKLLTGAALALGMAVATAALSVSLDVGDRLAKEFRGLRANLLVTPATDSLPLEIGGVDYRPVDSGAYLPEADLGKLKTIFWHNNIVAFAPALGIRTQELDGSCEKMPPGSLPGKVNCIPHRGEVHLVGTWSGHGTKLPDGQTFLTGIERTNPWWNVEGRWFTETVAPDLPDQVVVGRRLAQQLNISLTAPITLFGLHSAQEQYPARVVGIVSTGGPEDDDIMAPLQLVQKIAGVDGKYKKLYVSALTKPEDEFARRDPKSMNADELERWSCSPYVSSIAYTIKQVLPGADVRVIRRVADGEGAILTRVRLLLWLVTGAALLAAALALGASSAASVIERRTEIGLMKALGAGSATVGFLLTAEQLLLAFVGGGVGYALGIVLARLLGERIFGAAPEPSLLVFFLILFLAAVVTMLGSAIPLRRASRFEPAPILRGE